MSSAGTEPLFPDGAEFGPAMAALPSDRHRNFVMFHVVDVVGDNHANAARRAGFGKPDSSDLTFAKIAYRLFQDARINAAISEVAWRHFGCLAGKVIRTINDVLDDSKARPADKIKASLGVADRLWPQQHVMSVQHQHHHVVELDHTKAALESLRFLKSMRVPREVLIEQFGHSGLVRYERQLEHEDLEAMARAKLIEAREAA